MQCRWLREAWASAWHAWVFGQLAVLGCASNKENRHRGLWMLMRPAGSSAREAPTSSRRCACQPSHRLLSSPVSAYNHACLPACFPATAFDPAGVHPAAVHAAAAGVQHQVVSDGWPADVPAGGCAVAAAVGGLSQRCRPGTPAGCRCNRCSLKTITNQPCIFNNSARLQCPAGHCLD